LIKNEGRGVLRGACGVRETMRALLRRNGRAPCFKLEVRFVGGGGGLSKTFVVGKKGKKAL